MNCYEFDGKGLYDGIPVKSRPSPRHGRIQVIMAGVLDGRNYVRLGHQLYGYISEGLLKAEAYPYLLNSYYILKGTATEGRGALLYADTSKIYGAGRPGTIEVVYGEAQDVVRGYIQYQNSLRAETALLFLSPQAIIKIYGGRETYIVGYDPDSSPKFYTLSEDELESHIRVLKAGSAPRDPDLQT